MSQSDRKGARWSAAGLLLLVSLLAVALFNSPGTGDRTIWYKWMREMSTYGLIGGFNHSQTDYPPIALVILNLIPRLASVVGVDAFYVLKASLLLFLFATAACYYWFTRDLILTAILELTLLLNSVALVYLDIYFAPFLIAGLFFLQRGNLNLGFLLFTISCFIKWQPLIIAPFVCFYVLGAPAGDATAHPPNLKRRFLPFVLAAIIVALPLAVAFGVDVVHAFERATTLHPYPSANGLNFNWLHTWLLHLAKPEAYGPLQNGEINIINTQDPLIIWPEKILFFTTYAAILLMFIRQQKTFVRLIVYSMLGYMSYFLFNTGVHENHLFPICCLAWILVFVKPLQLFRCINLSIAANANLFLFYGAFGDGLHHVIGRVDITIFFAVANICLFIGLLVHTIKKDGVDLWLIKVTPQETTIS